MSFLGRNRKRHVLASFSLVMSPGCHNWCIDGPQYKNNNSSSSNAPNKGDIQVRTDNAQFSMAGTLKSLFASYTLLLLLCFYCTPILMIRGRRRTEEDSSAEWGMRSSPEFLNGVVGGSGLVSSLPAMHCILFLHNHHNHQIATRVRKWMDMVVVSTRGRRRRRRGRCIVCR